MKSLQSNDVWELVPLPTGKKTVGSKWVFKVKSGAERHKARLVAQGFTQRYGSDYDETFCPVVRQESLCVLITLSVQYSLKLRQVDVTTAFLNGNLEEEGTTKWLCKTRRGASCLQAKQEHLWLKAVTQMLEYCTLRIWDSHNRLVIPASIVEMKEERSSTLESTWTTSSWLEVPKIE